MQAATFEFRQDDYSRIILKDSLFNNIGEIPAADSLDLSRELEWLQAKETRLYLHAVTLSGYIRVKRIPRGLRINKGPILDRDNEQFCYRWVEILNKCSFDLMALTIQEVTTTLARIRDEITSAKQQLPCQITDSARLQHLLAQCEQQKDELLKEITASKKKKFERDPGDYASGKVYQWGNPRSKHDTYKRKLPTTQGRRGNFSTNSHNDLSTDWDSESTSLSQSSRSFLDGS